MWMLVGQCNGFVLLYKPHDIQLIALRVYVLVSCVMQMMQNYFSPLNAFSAYLKRDRPICFSSAMDIKRRNGGPPVGGGTQAKRGKVAGNEWEDSPSHFEEELSMFDEEMDAEDMEGQAGHDVIPVGRC